MNEIIQDKPYVPRIDIDVEDDRIIGKIVMGDISTDVIIIHMDGDSPKIGMSKCFQTDFYSAKLELECINFVFDVAINMTRARNEN